MNIYIGQTTGGDFMWIIQFLYQLGILICFVLGKLFSLIMLIYIQSKAIIENNRMRRLEKFYQQNPTKIRALMLENEKIRKKLITVTSANNINKRISNNGKTKTSCLCTRLSIIALRITHNIPAEEIEKIIGFSSGTISEWLRNFKWSGLLGIIPRVQIPWSIKFRTPYQIIKLVWKIHDDNPSFAKLRITQTLLKLLIFISPNTVAKILKNKRPKPWSAKPPRNPIDDIPHTNKIITKHSNHIWSIDLYSVMVGFYQCNILAVIDHFSRKLMHINFCFGEPDSSWIINNLRYSVSEYDCPKHLITDHGSQFMNDEFMQFLHNYKIKHRKGKVGSPYPNGKIERSFLSLKYELLDYFPFLTEQRIRELLRDYHGYYNKYRPHQSLNGEYPDNIYYGNNAPSAKPQKHNKIIKGKIIKKNFCEGIIKAYVLQ